MNKKEYLEAISEYKNNDIKHYGIQQPKNPRKDHKYLYIDKNGRYVYEEPSSNNSRPYSTPNNYSTPQQQNAKKQLNAKYGAGSRPYSSPNYNNSNNNGATTIARGANTAVTNIANSINTTKNDEKMNLLKAKDAAKQQRMENPKTAEDRDLVRREARKNQWRYERAKYVYGRADYNNSASAVGNSIQDQKRAEEAQRKKNAEINDARKEAARRDLSGFSQNQRQNEIDKNANAQQAKAYNVRQYNAGKEEEYTRREAERKRIDDTNAAIDSHVKSSATNVISDPKFAKISENYRVNKEAHDHNNNADMINDMMKSMFKEGEYTPVGKKTGTGDFAKSEKELNDYIEEMSNKAAMEYSKQHSATSVTTLKNIKDAVEEQIRASLA